MAKGKEVTKEEGGIGVVSRTGSFLSESVREIKKVQTPTRAETFEFTFRVIILIVVFSGFLGVIDFFLGYAMKILLT